MSGDPAVAHDDLGHPCDLRNPPARVVSLVPSLTESVAFVDQPVLVGATDWCTHPAGLDVARVRGTKNPHVQAIIDLKPDLVLANKEENRQRDVAKLRNAGICVWVTKIETVDEALFSLRVLFVEALQQAEPGWLVQARDSWAQPAPLPRRSMVIPVWRDPWMVVGRATFAGDLAARLGLHNVFQGHAERYPHVELEAIRQSQPDLVLLPDEPYPFAAADGPDAFDGFQTRLVSGRSLTWYGPSLTTARERLLREIDGSADTSTGGA